MERWATFDCYGTFVDAVVRAATRDDVEAITSRLDAHAIEVYGEPEVTPAIVRVVVRLLDAVGLSTSAPECGNPPV